MQENKSRTIEIDREKWDSMSTEEHATICQMVFRTLADKVDELVELFSKLDTTYHDEMAMAGISLVCSLNSLAFDDEPPCQAIIGSSRGVMHAILPLMQSVDQALKEARA